MEYLLGNISQGVAQSGNESISSSKGHRFKNHITLNQNQSQLKI
jgi:hypothetical protein